MRADLVPVWLLRAAWLVLVPAGIVTFGGALDGRSGAVQAVAAIDLWLGWAVGLVATLVPAAVSLTTIRLLAPAVPVAGIVALIAGAGAVAGVVTIALGLLTSIVAFTAEIGVAFVQAGAYGDESRLLLRPPGPLVAGPLEMAWVILAACVGTGPLLLAAKQWLPGALLTALAAVLVVPLIRRFHRLTLRWFVFVPAGIVVRDPLVLADTAMFRRGAVATIALAPATTDATDLTAKALGPAVEVALNTTGVVAVAGTLSDRAPRSTPVRAFLVSPSRPGRLLEEAARRGYAATPPPRT
jgi:hypothetical protein